MREKLDRARAEAKIRGNDDRTRVSTDTKAKTEAIYIEKSMADSEANEITQMAKDDIKDKAKL